MDVQLATYMDADDVVASGLCALHVVLVELLVDKLADRGDVAAVGQHAGAGWHDVIGGDVVTYLEQYRQPELVR